MYEELKLEVKTKAKEEEDEEEVEEMYVLFLGVSQLGKSPPLMAAMNFHAIYLFIFSLFLI